VSEEARVKDPEATPEPAPEYEVTEKDVEAGVCPECHGAGGHHYLNCEYLKNDAVDDVDLECDERNPSEGNDEIPPAQSVGGKPLSEEQIKEHFDTADKLFEGKKFEDGAVVSGEDAREALPPTDNELASNDMLWLVAKCCHEANRGFCAEVMGDRSHAAWEDTKPELRASIYAGVVNVFEHPDITPEQSHAAWVDYKVAEGWKYSNAKNVELKTHPNLAPWHQLHVNERFKDTLFITICKTFLGGPEDSA
jgi:hypothetical protein